MFKHAIMPVAFICVVACAGDRPGDAGRASYARDAVPRTEPLSKRGNPDSYLQNGRRYFVLSTARGYSERGIASWYGKKFHGRSTSSGETYNMYAMTAAHTTLPLPTYVRVTNLNNNRSVVVKVNDRGPFVANRLIDLSYAAAEKLDMVREGTALVEVVAVQAGETADTRDMPSRYKGAVDWRDESHLKNRIYIQIGAFSVRQNAEKILQQLVAANVTNAQILNPAVDAPVHRVRIGPLDTVAATDQMVVRLAGLGFADYQVVIE